MDLATSEHHIKQTTDSAEYLIVIITCGSALRNNVADVWHFAGGNVVSSCSRAKSPVLIRCVFLVPRCASKAGRSARSRSAPPFVCSFVLTCIASKPTICLIIEWKVGALSLQWRAKVSTAIRLSARR